MKKPAVFVLIAALLTGGFPVSAAFASDHPLPYSDDYMLAMARVDFHLRKQEYYQAFEALGQLPKEYQEDPLFKRYFERVNTGLSALQKRETSLAKPERKEEFYTRTRVVRRIKDSDPGSDQSWDDRGTQVNQRLVADIPGSNDIRGKFNLDLDGYQDGHNDLRYRSVIADIYKNKSHVVLGDSATFTSHYFMRTSRVRGGQVYFPGQHHDFQALAGGYPYWDEKKDHYIYPRKVFGLRDKWKFAQERFNFGFNVVNTRDDDGGLHEIDLANISRDNTVFSMDQEVKPIPDVWIIKASEAYSITDENLLDDRFLPPEKLKDTAFDINSTFIQPWIHWNSHFVRTGPDFRLQTDLPSGSLLRSKSITADRQLFENFYDFKPFGPFDLDLQTSWYRNDLDFDDQVEQTRQGWYTADLGILVPESWPKPRLRATMIDTLSEPGTETRPTETRNLSYHGELTHEWNGLHFTEFGDYDLEHPLSDKPRFSNEQDWSLGARMFTTVAKRWMVTPHYTYRVADELFNEQRVGGINHEAGISNSFRLWSTANLTLGYTYFKGRWANREGTPNLAAHTGSAYDAGFFWPYTLHTWKKTRRLTITPSANYHLTNLSNDLENHHLVVSRLTMGYEIFKQWKFDVSGEYRWDADSETADVNSEEVRIWTQLTAQWK